MNKPPVPIKIKTKSYYFQPSNNSYQYKLDTSRTDNTTFKYSISSSSTLNDQFIFGAGSSYFIESTNNLKRSNSDARLLVSTSLFNNLSSKNSKPKTAPSVELFTAQNLESSSPVKSSFEDPLLQTVRTSTELCLNSKKSNEIKATMPSFSRFWNELQQIKKSDPKLRKQKISFNYFS